MQTLKLGIAYGKIGIRALTVGVRYIKSANSTISRKLMKSVMELESKTSAMDISVFFLAVPNILAPLNLGNAFGKMPINVALVIGPNLLDNVSSQLFLKFKDSKEELKSILGVITIVNTQKNSQSQAQSKNSQQQTTSTFINLKILNNFRKREHISVGKMFITQQF